MLTWSGVGSWLAVMFVVLIEGGRSFAQETPAPTASSANVEEVRDAVRRGLMALDRSAARYPEHRACFSCHHQTLPLLAQKTAEVQGYSVDAALRQSQRAFSLKSFSHRIDDLRAGQGIGGRAMTVSYALWALALSDHSSDETSAALASYLLKAQRSEGHWIGQTSRPPLEESYQTCTVLAIRGLEKFADGEQKEIARTAINKARDWLLASPAKSQEDKNLRLWGLYDFESSAPARDAALQAVLSSQRTDGGWAQLDEMDSDAYATGQTLLVLQSIGRAVTDDVYRRGMTFLVRNQRTDGAWLVETRSKAIQPYYDFDDEDPLGKNQFISVAASSWAVAALAAGQRASD
jgi:N-acyl-D-amino-acid deacylase